jgi:Domain of unknown function (DUF1772)
MLPTNFRLVEMNEKKGGARSEKSASRRSGHRVGSAAESVEVNGQASEFRDLSGPQQWTDKPSNQEEDRKVRELLGKFAMLNGVRTAMMFSGGVVGLVTALVL